MHNISRIGLVICLVAFAGCDGGDSRSSGPGAPPQRAAEEPATALQPEPAKPMPPPAWSKRDEETLKAAIDGRASHGLDHMNFWPSLEGKTPEARETALNKAALRYAGALAKGAVDPLRLYDIYELKRPELDVEAGLRDAIGKGGLKEWLDGLAPHDEGYAALSKAYLSESRSTGKGRDIAEGELLRPGASDGRVPQVREALADKGYLREGGDASDGDEYGRDLVTAVKALQRDFGLNPDGIIGPSTLAILNAGPGDRARTLAVAMERLRWLARQPGPDRIDVNTAAAEMSYIRGGQPVDLRRVISGKPRTATPQLEAPLYRLVANPLWTLPRSIQGEVTAKGDEYIANNGFYWRNGRLVQRSGPGNSLGLAKFDMRNNHAIYLHDTPSKALFARQQRQLSHGCVRVDDAEGFAAKLAADEGVEAEWSEARQKAKETFVSLPREIPVRLMYQTAYATNEGTIRYTTDPYGWDDAVAQKLGFQIAAKASEFKSDVADTGP